MSTNSDTKHSRKLRIKTSKKWDEAKRKSGERRSFARAETDSDTIKEMNDTFDKIQAHLGGPSKAPRWKVIKEALDFYAEANDLE